MKEKEVYKVIYYDENSETTDIVLSKEQKEELPLLNHNFEESIVYGKTLKAASKWASTIESELVPDINKNVMTNPKQFIQICETKHNNMLAELGQTIAKDIENIRLILIAGPSSSGKTTFSNRLRIELMSLGIKPITISMDDYYLKIDYIYPFYLKHYLIFPRILSQHFYQISLIDNSLLLLQLMLLSFFLA